MKKWLWIVAVAAAICAGCSKSGSDKAKDSASASSSKDSMLASLKDEDVLIRIGTNVFTKATFMRLCDLKVHVMRMANKKQIMQMKRDLNPLAIEMQTLVAYPGKVIVETVLREYAATNGLAISAEDRKEARRSFQAACQSGFTGWKEFVKGFPEKLRGEIDEEIERIAIVSAMRRSYFDRNKIEVTDKEAADCQRWVADYNRKASLTNAAIWATASNVWQRVAKNHMSFEEAANKYTQDENEPENGEWAAFSLDAFADEPELAKTILGMKVGGMTPPIEGDNGLMILKLVDIEKPEKQGEPTRYLLSRIFFRLPEFYEEVKLDELKATMLETKRSKAFASFVENLTKAAKVSFPSGKTVFAKAKEALKLPTTTMF